MIDEIKNGSRLGLFNCDPLSKLQKFEYDSSAKEFRPGSNNELCLAVNEESRKEERVKAIRKNGKRDANEVT